MTTATCHTDGCENAGHAIGLDFLPDDEEPVAVVCGACGNPISDVSHDGD